MLAFIRQNPALWSGIFFALGIVLSFEFIAEIPLLTVWILLAILFLAVPILARKSAARFLLLSAGLFFLIGLLYGYQHFAFYSADHLLNFQKSKIAALKGWISETTIRKNGKHRYVLSCRYVLVDSAWQPARGKVMLSCAKGLPRLHYGQRILVRSPLEWPPLPNNPGQFNYRRYLNLKGIFFSTYVTRKEMRLLPGKRGSPLMRLVLIPVRQAINTAFERYFSSPTEDILKALILGERQNLNADLVQRFQKVGVVHVLAISGLHVGFVLLIFLIFFGFFPLSYKMRYALTFLALGFFVALVNFKAPVVRASLMALLYFVIPLTQRKASALNILAVAAWLILVFDPAQILQPGFQFSFAAVGGIVYGYTHLKKLFPVRFGKSRPAQWANRLLWQPALVSLSAVLATLPLTWYYFGTVQIGAVLINLLIIPLIGLLVILGLLFVLLYFAGFPFLAGLAALISALCKAILAMIAFFSRFDWVQVQLGHPSLTMALLLGLCILFFFRIYRPVARTSAAISLGLLLLLWQNNRLHNMRLTFFDVGQGDACLIQIPPNMNVLVDGGDRNRWRDYGKRSVLPVCRYYGVKHLRYALATHAHSDHYGGLLTIIRSLRVDTLVISPYPDSSRGYRHLLSEALRRGIPVVTRHRGQVLNLGPQARAYVLSPLRRFEKVKIHNGREINNSSLVLRVSYGQTHFLLTGDAQKEAEEVLASYGTFLKSTVLKVGHHGSATSSSELFLKKVRPAFAVISVGWHNKFHLPSAVTIHKLQGLGIPTFRTDHFGALVFESNGQKVWLNNWRSP